jgi:hypothetical protein
LSKRPTITPTMKLEVLRRAKTLVPCSECMREALAKESDPKVIPLWLVSQPLENIQFDHHLALVDGGEHSVENLRPLCPLHHRIKSAREHVANCKAKRLANPKPSKHPMPKTGRKIPAHVNPWGKR